MKMFKSDNVSGVHPRILEAMLNVNQGHEDPYGGDRITKKADLRISQAFGKEVDIYYVVSGTAANVIGLSGLLKPFEAVVCADTAHINTDECGAFERFTGSKILTVRNKEGKISKEDLEVFLHLRDNEHKSQVKIISISQTSEVGTLYTVEEIKELADFAHKNNMYLHVDGARLANAVVALDSTFKEMITDTGVDLLSFGGTKNGMMIGEAILSFNKDLSRDFKFHRKQGMQLLSKMRYISAQFIAYLEKDLWKENAENANNMGQYLASELSRLPGVELAGNMKTNMIFAHVDGKIIDKLQDEFGFHTIDAETNLIRLVTSFDTSKEDIDKFIRAIKQV